MLTIKWLSISENEATLKSDEERCLSGIRAKNNLVMYGGSKGFTGVMIVYDFGICIDIQNRGEGNVKVMLLPDAMKGLLQRAEAVAVRLHILKPSAEGGGRTAQFVESYRHAVQFLCNHKGKIVVVTGITEQMYLAVFQIVFHSEYLMPSLYMTRGISFYFLLVCSIVVVLGNRMVRKRRG